MASALLRSILRMALAWDELITLPVFEMAHEHGCERFFPRRKSPGSSRRAASRRARCWSPS